MFKRGCHSWNFRECTNRNSLFLPIGLKSNIEIHLQSLETSHRGESRCGIMSSALWCKWLTGRSSEPLTGRFSINSHLEKLPDRCCLPFSKSWTLQRLLWRTKTANYSLTAYHEMNTTCIQPVLYMQMFSDSFLNGTWLPISNTFAYGDRF